MAPSPLPTRCQQHPIHQLRQSKMSPDCAKGPLVALGWELLIYKYQNIRRWKGVCLHWVAYKMDSEPASWALIVARHCSSARSGKIQATCVSVLGLPWQRDRYWGNQITEIDFPTFWSWTWDRDELGTEQAELESWKHTGAGRCGPQPLSPLLRKRRMQLLKI